LVFTKSLIPFRREIQITKKFRFELKHILAIIAHESTHNYLNQKNIRIDDERDNEILTDSAAAYLGLGNLILEGYEPIIWTTDHWISGNSRGHTTRTLTIGYINTDNIRFAVAKSAVLREIEEFTSLLPFFDRWIFSSKIKIKINMKAKNERKNKKSVELLTKKMRK
jgi:hypothetical protein